MRSARSANACGPYFEVKGLRGGRPLTRRRSRARWKARAGRSPSNRSDVYKRQGRSRAKAGAGARSPFRAMLAKEARLLLATPIYLLNGCMGYVLVVVGAAALLAMSKTGALPLDQLPPELVPLLGQFVPWGLAFLSLIHI